MMSTSDEQTINEFIEKMGLMSQADGLPKIAGKIFASLVMYDEPLSFSQLTERLSVSRASVSNNTRLLTQLGIIERVNKLGERQDYFALKDNPYLSLMQGMSERTSRVASVIEQTQSKLDESNAATSGAKERLEQMRDFYIRFRQAIQTLT